MNFRDRALGFSVGALLMFASQSSSAGFINSIDVPGINMALMSQQLDQQKKVPIAELVQGPTMTIANTGTLGIVSVGTDKQNRNVGYRLVVAMVTVTPTDSDAREALEECSVGFSEDVKGLRTLLDSYVQSSSDMLLSLPADIGARNAEMKRRQEAAKASTQSAFALFQQAVVQKLAVCHAVKNMAIPVVSIGLTSTPCVIGSPECPFSKARGLERFQKIADLYERAQRLDKIKDWSMVAITGEVGAFDAKLTLPTLPTAITLSSSDVQANLSRRVEELRAKARAAKSELIQPVTAALAGLSSNDIVRMADVLSSPNAAVRMAWGKSDQALNVSDELARVRILECAKFQGKTKVTDIASCSGYKIIDEKSLDDCLKGDLCRPVFGDKMNFNVALLAERLNVKKLAVSADLPRLINANIQFPAYQKAAFNCANANRSDAASMVTCLSQAQFPDQKVKDVLGCAQTMVGAKRDSVITECLDIALGANSKEAQIAQCLLKAGEDGTQRMMCAAQKAMDPATAKALNCAMKVTSAKQISSCVSDPNVAKLLKAKECIDAGGDAMTISLCMAQENADPSTRAALSCMVQSGGDYKKGLACAAFQNVSGDAGLVLRCAASSGGDPRGTAICAVTPGLTPEQQIALSCAVTATTGPGYAACVGGQLTLKEYMNCKGYKFAEGKCFGDGNELRKFSKNVLGQDIGPNSVVAQVINVHLDVTNGTIALTESLLREGGKALEKLNNELTTGLSQAGRAAEDLAVAAAGGLAAGLNVATPNITVGSSGVSVSTPIAGVKIGDGHVSVNLGGIHVGF
ncbi:hypothetical protein H8F23_23420 [Pseudomonas sp. P155]|uniref:Uncharacterized protein n=1 Tax=Pseudomonas neuropathica TaxID=2730425 RepID=A0ABS0BPE1_9PSED|nr:hypothetical protein [Pseudomonas neuropathica]MBF6036209.1 hypothetical protein [Pseudomonas neuropathica]